MEGRMLDFLKGYKTYIVVAIAVLTAIVAYFGNQLTLLQSLQAIGLALGLGGNRALVRAVALLHTRYGVTSPTDPAARAYVVYASVALTILTAVLAQLNGQQDLLTTVNAVLAALGLNFLGMGAKKAALGDAT
jgi:hypothetical protein